MAMASMGALLGEPVNYRLMEHASPDASSLQDNDICP